MVAGVALTLVVLLAFTGVVVAKHAGWFGGGGEPGPAVVLLPANVAGEDAFMPSVVVAPVEIGDTVTATMSSFTAQLPRAAARGARLVPGTQRELYGGTGEDVVCDVPGIANYLDVHPERSSAWAQAIGIAPQKIPYYLNTLTPVALITDTWITASTFGDGRAASEQAVLQAGNAVLVDQAGVPRVHCATGNPLAPPANIDLAALTVQGKKWPMFNPQNVVAVAYSVTGGPQPVATEFVLRDVSSGEPITRKAGGGIAIGADPAGWAPDPVAMNVPPPAGKK